MTIPVIRRTPEQRSEYLRRRIGALEVALSIYDYAGHAHAAMRDELACLRLQAAAEAQPEEGTADADD